MNVNIKLVDKFAKVPTYATDGSGCFDFYSIEPKEVSFQHPAIIRTGLEIEIPKGYSLFIFSRSGHGFKEDVRLGNCVGVIDSDYRGEIMIKLSRDQPGRLFFKLGDRIAQGCILPTPQIKFNPVDVLSNTERGTGGFGSTG